MKKILLSIVIFGLLITSCAPRMSDDFKLKISDLLKEGSTLNALTEQGVSFVNFGEQLAITKGAFDLANSVWPEKYNPEAKDLFEKAFTGWNLALTLWNDKINKYDNPVEPDINRYQDFINYAGDSLIIDEHPSDFIVKAYQGKKFVTFDNIGILLSLASDYFSQAQSLVQEDMK